MVMILVYLLLGMLFLYAIYLILGIPKIIPENVRVAIVVIAAIILIIVFFQRYGSTFGVSF